MRERDCVGVRVCVCLCARLCVCGCAHAWPCAYANTRVCMCACINGNVRSNVRPRQHVWVSV
eukprot:2619797-Alexandrium_andersonii.AAC.1